MTPREHLERAISDSKCRSGIPKVTLTASEADAVLMVLSGLEEAVRDRQQQIKVLKEMAESLVKAMQLLHTLLKRLSSKKDDLSVALATTQKIIDESNEVLR